MTQAATPQPAPTPFPAIHEDMLTRLSQRAEDLVRDEPKNPPRRERQRWFQ